MGSLGGGHLGSRGLLNAAPGDAPIDLFEIDQFISFEISWFVSLRLIELC